MFRSRLIVAFAAYLMLSVSVESAEIRIDPSSLKGAGATFEGRIEAGDFDKFKKFILEDPRIVEVYLGRVLICGRPTKCKRFLKKIGT
jgi:hypothetical protein